MGVIHITNMGSHLVPDVQNRVQISAFGWPVHHFHVLIFGKSHSGSSPVWRSIILNYLRVIAKCAPCPRQEILPEHPSVNLLVYGALKPRLAHSCPGMKGAPYHDEWHHIAICCTQASIYLSPSGMRTRIQPSRRYSLKRDSSEKTQCFQWWRYQSIFKHQLGCRFDIMDSISSFFVFWHMQ